MRQALYLTERTAILALAAAFAAGAQTPPPAKPAPQTPAKAASAPTVGQAQPAAKPAAKPVTKTPAPKPAAKPAPAKPKPAPVQAAAPKKETKKPAKPVEAAAKEEGAATTLASSHRRDPFLAMISASAAGGSAPIHLPDGKAGLQVSTLHVEGVVRSPNGMLVVVNSPRNRTYFLHQGDRVYDGKVEQISMDAVTFQETGKDPFGKAIDRTVVKRIYQSAGEQQ